MRYITLREVMEIHSRLISASGGSPGVRDLAALDSAVAQPRMTFGGEDLYPTIIQKAAALLFSLIQNHPFVDGNKRAGHAAAEVFLMLNGREIRATVDEQEELVLGVASSTVSRNELVGWLAERVVGRAGERSASG
jgi:death-on-curing protein